jgi:enoyl-CoA hydratase/carnithine racemase
VSDDQPLLVERSGRVAILRLNRPHVLNALSHEMVDALVEAVGAAGSDPDVGAILLTAEGRTFCAGGDLTEMLAMDAPTFRRYIEAFQELSRRMHRISVPTVAELRGHVLAGGLELACEVDIRIAATDAVFGNPDTRLGGPPTSGLTWILPRLVGDSWARHLLLTSEFIDATTAERIGLVTRVVESADLDRSALGLATAVADQPPLGLRHIRAELADGAETTFEDALTRELEAEVESFASPEWQASLRAFANRRSRPER